jgi:uncharacterized protein YaaQ
MTYKFIYPYENFIQTAFDKHEYKVKSYRGEGHIMIDGNTFTLCGITKDELKEGVANVSVLASRLPSVKLCPKCQEAWKQQPDSPWRKWAESIAQ